MKVVSQESDYSLSIAAGPEIEASIRLLCTTLCPWLLMFIMARNKKKITKVEELTLTENIGSSTF